MHITAQHNYVISLATEQKRRKHIENEFGKQEISFEFFDAVTPATIDKVAKDLNIIVDRSETAILWDGEIACALSHIFLWNFVLENNLDYINIFEDDIHLGENAKELLNIDYIPKDTHVLKLEANGKYFSKKPTKVKNDREIFPLSFKQSGTAGYCVTAKGAKYLLNQVQHKELKFPIDMLMFEKLLAKKDYKVMQLSPAICVQDFIFNPQAYFESSLQTGRERIYKNRIKTSFLTKMNNEWIRIKRKFFAKPIPFK